MRHGKTRTLSYTGSSALSRARWRLQCVLPPPANVRGAIAPERHSNSTSAAHLGWGGDEGLSPWFALWPARNIDGRPQRIRGEQQFARVTDWQPTASAQVALPPLSARVRSQ